MTLCAIVGNTGVTADVSLAAMGQLIERDSQILAGEILAVFLLFREFADALHGVPFIIFIDNMSVVHIFASGSAKQADIGTLAHALHVRLVQVQTAPWFEHVESWSNIADGGTRAGPRCPISASAGIHLVAVEPFRLPGLSLG